jgi:hypothetical protein
MALHETVFTQLSTLKEKAGPVVVRFLREFVSVHCR